jgi:hypothetical protein
MTYEYFGSTSIKIPTLKQAQQKLAHRQPAAAISEAADY